MRQLPEVEAYYRDLFTRDPNRSMRYPTRNECTRLGKICEYLSEIAWRRGNPAELEARILDLGCGRGWLTPLLAVYGASEGIDPIAAVIEQARRHHPATKFRVGTAHDVLRDPAFRPYDVVIVSEVIEHVPYAQQDYFMQEIRALIAPNGFAIITTPRREWIAEWQRAGLIWQPVEDWLTDSELQTLFTRNGFTLIREEGCAHPTTGYVSIARFRVGCLRG
ncbi:MAG: methyltransferase domain-containing protein [Chloroflexi bacterium]|nr:methyltransferase domain-containing protein [Chloroflexota bacterium]